MFNRLAILSPDVLEYSNGNMHITLNAGSVVFALGIVCVGWVAWVIWTRRNPPTPPTAKP